MTEKQLEKRLAAVEKELAQLKSKLAKLNPQGPWWERIASTFQGDEVYEKAMKLGRQYRRSLRPKGPTTKRK